MVDHPETSSTSLSDKVALVTGAARGIGVEISRELAKLGAHVIVAARDLVKAEQVVSDLRDRGGLASALKLDVTNEADRNAAYHSIEAAHGKLDILINNAGILLDSPDGGTPAPRQPSVALPEVLRDTFEVNFFAPIFLTQLLLPLLTRSDAPRVVNVSSIRGSLAHLSDPTSPVYPVRALGYDTSKAALNAFTILIAEELRGTPIKINAIHPGWVRTEMGGEDAPVGLEEGARTAVKYATLGEDGPTGSFFFLDERLPW
ncbi:SDR family NAD(P)-dependent oxidoreductase [Rhizobium lusitanum]|uniref:SDR family NAD(P)-dependent oxidoreductase n=1 Tax=Rhizobium lusitanum TaxID=293958 RepID=A0A6L9UEZ7_9HYPH|nr:SDR family NAD(P)-dependent oxidoreductase [Rhizobium lusitanum]NEI73168.1 SDR family NAD(P)-dependent oxidoreductase [Rhizobium lusitanum]